MLKSLRSFPLFLLATSLSAQQPDSTAKIDTLVPVKTTISAIRGTNTTPITQTTLSATKIADRNFWQEMPFLLSTTPSVTVTADNGAFNGYTYMRLRGMDQTRINATLDGVPLNEPEDQGTYFSNFLGFNASVQSLQVQRGVGTSSNGSAAYAGSMNFESVNPLIKRRGIEYSMNRGYSADWTLASKADGVYVRHNQQDIMGYRDNSGNRSNSTYVTAMTVRSRYVAKFSGFTGVSRNQQAYLASPLSIITTNPTHNPLSPEEDDRFVQSFGSANLTLITGDNTTFNVTGYVNRLEGAYKVNLGDMYTFKLNSAWSGVITNWTYSTPDIRVDLGAHANVYNRAHAADTLGLELYRNSGDKNEQSAFVKVDKTVATGLHVIADVQARNVFFRYNPDQAAWIRSSNITWSFLNPKVGLTYLSSDKVKVYTSWGQNTREPTRTDMFAGFDNVDESNIEFVGALSRVRPERVQDLEVGVEYSGTNGALSANVFNMEFSNEIAAIGKLSYIGLPLRKNVSQSYRRGIEVDGSYRRNRVTFDGNVSLMQSRIKTYTDDETGAVYTNVRPLLTPSVLSNHSVKIDITSNVNVVLGGRYVGQSQLDNKNSTFTTPAFEMVYLNPNVTVGKITINGWITNLNNVRAFTGGYTDGIEPYYFVANNRKASIMLMGRLNF